MLDKLKIQWLQMRRKMLTVWLEWKYRKYSEDICCCGSVIGEGGDICRHGGCRSMKEWVISSAVERLK